MSATAQTDGGWTTAAAVSVPFVVVLFAAYALTISYMERERHRKAGSAMSVEEFVTARSRASTWLIAFSWFATAMGKHSATHHGFASVPAVHEAHRLLKRPH